MIGILTAFEGRLGQDAELRYTSNGNAMCSFSAAVETGKAQGSERTPSEWVKCVVFGDDAPGLVHQLGKGDQIYVEGRLTLNRWTDREGKDHAGLNVVATLVQPMGKIGRRPLGGYGSIRGVDGHIRYLDDEDQPF